MKEGYFEERKIEPMNILIAFLIGIGSALFIIGSIGSLNLKGDASTFLVIAVIIVYLIVVFALLKPKKYITKLGRSEIIEKEIIKEIEKPVGKIIEKPVIKYRDRPILREIEKKVLHPVVIEKEKKEPKKSKYVGSSYNEKYHLRDCRFAGAIKKEYLVEEDDRKYFKLRGYEACKVCHPEK